MYEDRIRNIFCSIRTVLPLEVEIGENLFFSVLAQEDEDFYMCYLYDGTTKEEGTLRIRKDRLGAITYNEFYQLVSIIKDRAMQSVYRDCKQEREESYG